MGNSKTKRGGNIRLDLGGGTKNTVAPGHINIDLVSDADILWDLNKGLPLTKNGYITDRDSIFFEDKAIGGSDYAKPTIEGIRCHQVIEHLDTIILLMNDCYEVLKPGAIFELSTPDGMSRQLWQDPTHKRGYVWETFIYFSDSEQYADAQEEYGITARFKYLDHWMDNGWNLQIRLTK